MGATGGRAGELGELGEPPPPAPGTWKPGAASPLRPGGPSPRSGWLSGLPENSIRFILRMKRKEKSACVKEMRSLPVILAAPLAFLTNN